MAAKGAREFGRRGADAAGGRASVSQRPAAVDPAGDAEPQPAVAAVSASVAAAVTAVVAVVVTGLTALVDARAAGPTLVVTFVILNVALRRDVVDALGALATAERDGGGRGASTMTPARVVAALAPRLLALAGAAAVLMAAGLGASVGAQGMTVAIFALIYMMFLKGTAELGDFVTSLKTVGSVRRRSRWFAIGLVAGAGIFVVNDQMGWVPLSLTDALGFDSDKTIVAIENSGVLPNINSTFSYSKGGPVYQAPSGQGATAGMPETEWERLKAWVGLDQRVSWVVDLVAFAVAAGFILNTIMVRFLGFADTGDLKSSD